MMIISITTIIMLALVIVVVVVVEAAAAVVVVVLVVVVVVAVVLNAEKNRQRKYKRKYVNASLQKWTKYREEMRITARKCKTKQRCLSSKRSHCSVKWAYAGCDIDGNSFKKQWQKNDDCLANGICFNDLLLER